MDFPTALDDMTDVGVAKRVPGSEGEHWAKRETRASALFREAMAELDTTTQRKLLETITSEFSDSVHDEASTDRSLQSKIQILNSVPLW